MVIDNLYFGEGGHHGEFVNASFEFNTDVLSTFLRRIYNGFDTSKDFEPTMWREILRVINEATVEGLTHSSYDISQEEEFLKSLAHSNEVFSAFKVHAMGVDMAKKLIGENGKLKPFEQWKKDVAPIASHYCGSWLQTEYSTAVLRGHFAAEWKQYVADADIFPNLRWMSTTSATPDEEHKFYWMNRLTLPVSHPFWETHHPGDHWNCKCSLEQTDEAANPELLDNAPEVKPQPGLKKNPGISGEIFDKSHPYIAGCDKKEQESVMKSLEKVKKGRTRDEILAAAKKRQEARTQEQKEDIQKRWDSRNEHSLGKLISDAEKKGIKYLKVKSHIGTRTEQEIIDTLSGGDMTGGSCSSLAFAYAGNKGGLDVLDFRNGKSREMFASSYNIRQIVQKVGGLAVAHTNDFTACKQLFSTMEKGKEYYFATGRHAAIIRRGENGLEYLELQSATRSGWHKLDSDSLRYRFKAQRSHSTYGIKFEMSSELIDIDLLNDNNGFRQLLGYINTEPKEQHKSNRGTIK